MKVIGRIREFARVYVMARLPTRYARSLEDEVARLRAENRALLDSILGIAGVAPALDVRGWTLEAGEKANADSSSRGRESAASRNDNTGSSDPLTAAAAGPPGRGPSFFRAGKQRPCDTASAAPLRRRSWQQIERALERADTRAAQRERESNTEAFPTPRKVVPRG